MRIISPKALREFASRHADARAALNNWHLIARGASWKNILELRATWRSAEAVGDLTVFNIKGNAYRLIARVLYKSQIIYIRAVLTHAEYDKENWKRR
jgi:mRNA interferase HigB